MAASAISNLTLGITAAAALAQYQAVTAAGAIATAAGNAVGFTQTTAASGDRVPVTAGGTAVAIAGAAVAVGAAVEVVGAVGKVVTKTSGITVARALTAAAADGDQIEVLIIPN
jgi:hypothetical protein